MEKATKAKIEMHGDVLVCHLSGKLDNLTTPLIVEQLKPYIDSGITRVIFDLEKLEYISSAGFRYFLVTSLKLEELSGGLIICTVPEAIRHFLAISGTLEILHVADSIQKALEDFSHMKSQS